MRMGDLLTSLKLIGPCKCEEAIKLEDGVNLEIDLASVKKNLSITNQPLLEADEI